MGNLQRGSSRFSTFLFGSLVLLLTASGVHAQRDFPIRPIRLIVTFPLGGPPDITARMLGPKLSESFGVPVIVDNRVGRSGAAGTEAAVEATPDGHTVILVSASYAAGAALSKLSYDPVNDVTPIALIGETGLMVTLHPSITVTGVKELISYAKAHPGKLSYGSGGVGSAIHLATELFNQMAGTNMTHAPYPGSGPALNGLMGGQIQVYLAPLPLAIPQLKSNRLRGIAVTTAKRSNAVPDIPTVAETLPDYDAVQWQALLGPKSLPKHVVARWNREINRVLQLPEVKERMARDSLDLAGGSPERFHEVLRRDVSKWKNVVKVAGIKAEK